jgi:uncharacterized protein (DUF1015 family)
MMYFSNMDDEGMTIWPTHRVIHSIEGLDAERFLSDCSAYFDIKEMTPAKADDQASMFSKRLMEEAGAGTSFGLKIKGIDGLYVLKLKSPDMMDRVFGKDIPEVFKGLDVTVLHSLVLSRILGISQEAQEAQRNIIYLKSVKEALGALEEGSNQLAFILNPTRIEQVERVAESGLVMPQKSTYFYPKLLSGLVINMHSTTIPQSV